MTSLYAEIRQCQVKLWKCPLLGGGVIQGWDEQDEFIDAITSEISTRGSYLTGCEYDLPGGHDPHNGVGRHYFTKQQYEERQPTVKYERLAEDQQSVWEQQQAEKHREKEAIAQREWEQEENRRREQADRERQQKQQELCRTITDENGRRRGTATIKDDGTCFYQVEGALWCQHKTLRETANHQIAIEDAIAALSAAGLSIAD